MCIYKKLQAARDFIKTTPIKKEGRNDYSGYDYYTPDQINFLVSNACKEVGIIELFDLKRNEFGMYGELKLINIDNTEEIIILKQSSDIPKITATNVAQQIGGAVTFTRRYMFMTAFSITDNNLDFDLDKKPKKENKKQEKIKEIHMAKSQYDEWLKMDAKFINNCIINYSNKIVEKDGVKKKYCMKDEYRIGLKKQYELLIEKK